VTLDVLDHQFYVLVTGTMPTYNVVGHKLALDAKEDRWRDDPGDRSWAYFVPQRELRPPPDIPHPPDPPTRSWADIAVKEWIVKFHRKGRGLPPQGIGPFKGTVDQAEARLIRVQEANPDLDPHLYTRVDEPPRQEFSRKYMFSDLEGEDNPPWWIEYDHRAAHAD